MRRLAQLVEFTRKELLNAVDPNFIHHKQYYKELPVKSATGTVYQGVHMVKISPYTHYEVKFKTGSAEYPGVFYDQKIILKDLRGLIRNKKSELTLLDKVRYAINNGDLLVGCNCPAAIFWGYNYILTALGAAHPDNYETRQPVIRNPQELGIMCKHAALALNTLPFHSSSIVKTIRDELPVRFQ